MSEIFLDVQDLCFLHRGPFSFSLERAECVGISGPSGIGKSQLFRALTDLIPAQGRVAVGGVERRAVEAPRWRTMITMLPTDSAWWFDVVKDHFPDTLDSCGDIDGNLAELGLPPEALEWQISRLSTGEKQRLALLRTLQTRPLVVLLDEPSSGLDPHHTLLMESFLRDKQETDGLTMVWVSHDPAQLGRVADRILIMGEDSLCPMEPENQLI